MDSRGFILIEVLTGLFFTGLVAVTCLPILSTAAYQLKLAKDKTDMVYMAESVIEEIKSFDDSLKKDDEYIYDIRLADLIEKLKEEDSVSIQLPLNMKPNNPEHMCIISKNYVDTDLWKIQVKILLAKEGKGIRDVEVTAYMPIPQDDQALDGD